MGVVIAVVLIAVIGVILFRTWSSRSLHSVSESSKSEARKRVRLTDQQIVVLSAASIDKPIYAENPSFLHAQMPNGAACFNLRTVKSLVSRGYLKSDGHNGYLLTIEGENGLRSGMGF